MPPIAVVTGSAGFVGRHLARRLEADGYRVLRVDPAHDPGGRRFGDVYGHDARWWFHSAGARQRVDLIVHCAAVVGGRTMIDGAPLQLAAEDLSLDADLFRWLLGYQGDTPPRVVYFSSSAAYPVRLQDRVGRSCETRLREGHIDPADPELPDQTYGWVKLTGERLAAEARAMGLPVHVFRPFSGYGADQDRTYPFPSFLDRARGGGDTFEVWGDGEQVRDFIHIDDIVDLVMTAVARDVFGPINLGTGVATSFNDLAHMMMTAAGTVRPLAHRTDAPTGVVYRVADVDQMTAELGEPKIDLAEGIRRSLTGP